MDPTTLAALIAVPSGLTALLMQVFQTLKTRVLAPYVPGFAPSDPSSNGRLRAVFFTLVVLMLLGWTLSGYAPGVTLPHDLLGWLQYAYVVLNSAGVLTGAAHLGYVHLSGNGSTGPDVTTDAGAAAASADPDKVYPPSDYDAGADLRAAAAGAVTSMTAPNMSTAGVLAGATAVQSATFVQA